MGPSGPSTRLFVAVAVPPRVREAILEAIAPLKSGGVNSLDRGVRWTEPAGWHLTVAFLGNTDPALVQPLTTALQHVASQCTPFVVQLRQSATRAPRSGVLWIDLEPSESLSLVAAAVVAALCGLGFPEEDRAFRPHLTLARSYGRASIPRSLVDAYAGPASGWTVPGLELVRSHLGRAGSRYEAVARLPFRQMDV